MFSPVCRVFDEGRPGEDERRGSQGGEVTVEGGNGLTDSVSLYCVSSQILLIKPVLIVETLAYLEE